MKNTLHGNLLKRREEIISQVNRLQLENQELRKILGPGEMAEIGKNRKNIRLLQSEMHYVKKLIWFCKSRNQTVSVYPKELKTVQVQY